MAKLKIKSAAALTLLVLFLSSGCNNNGPIADFAESADLSAALSTNLLNNPELWEFASEGKSKHHSVFDDFYYSDEDDTTSSEPPAFDLFDKDDAASSGYDDLLAESEPQSEASSNNTASAKDVSNDNLYDPSFTTMRERLTGKDAEMYDALFEAFSKYELRVILKGTVESEKLDYIYRCISDDHPELFWVPYGYRGGYYMEYLYGQTLVQYDALDTMDVESIPRCKEEFNKRVDEIISSIPDGLSQYEKVLYIHDYIVQNCDYVEDSDSCYSAYGCLINKKAVCSGYTPAFQVLLHRLDIECGNVVGFATSSAGAHTWNYVRLDGDYYWADVTWDDPVSSVASYEGEGDVSHSYFLITSEQLARTHAISEKESPFIPNCTATKYNYMNVTGSYMEEYSFEEFNRLLSERSGHLAVQFGNRDAFIEAQREIIYDDKIGETDYVKKTGAHTYSYIIDEDMLIIEFKF